MLQRTILIADDEAYLTQILSHNIQKTGAKVEIARNGADAILSVQKHRPDLIVTDYQMPVLDGFQMCLQLKQDPATADIPVLMLTARGHRLSPSDLLRTNIKLLLPKPFSSRELLARIGEILAALPVNATDEVLVDASTASRTAIQGAAVR